jgi:hypothetical protein
LNLRFSGIHEQTQVVTTTQLSLCARECRWSNLTTTDQGYTLTRARLGHGNQRIRGWQCLQLAPVGHGVASARSASCHQASSKQAIWVLIMIGTMRPPHLRPGVTRTPICRSWNLELSRVSGTPLMTWYKIKLLPHTPIRGLLIGISSRARACYIAICWISASCQRSVTFSEPYGLPRPGVVRGPRGESANRQSTRLRPAAHHPW